jgi:hypothetical protein
MVVGKYVSSLTASQPRLYRVDSKAATRGLFLLRRVQCVILTCKMLR